MLAALDVKTPSSTRGDVLYSPPSSLTTSQTLKWRVALFPNGTKQSRGHVGIYIYLLGYLLGRRHHCLTPLSTSSDELSLESPAGMENIKIKGNVPAKGQDRSEPLSPKPEHWQKSLRGGSSAGKNSAKWKRQTSMMVGKTSHSKKWCMHYSIELFDGEGTPGKMDEDKE